MSQNNILEQQNNQRLEELSRKVTSLRDVTLDIHSQAADQSYLDQGTEIISRFSTSVKTSSGKLARMISSNSPKRIPSMWEEQWGVVLKLVDGGLQKMGSREGAGPIGHSGRWSAGNKFITV